MSLCTLCGAGFDFVGEHLPACATRGEHPDTVALRAVREAWANQLRDLIPRIGLRAISGVPEEVLALLHLETQGEPAEEP